MPGAKHDGLLQEKGGRGFPYLVFLDAEGTLAGKHNFDRSAEGFGKTGALVRDLAKAKKGSADEFVLKAELGLVDAAEIRKNAKPEGATPEQVKRLETALANHEVQETLDGLRGARDKSVALDAGKKLLEMKTAGRVPTWSYPTQGFWMLIMDFAESEKDAASFEEALNTLKPKLEKLPGGQAWIDKKTEILKQLKEQGKQ